MEAILYAEVYCICIIVSGVLFFWTKKNGMRSFSELCLSRLLACFTVNFAVNLLFTVFSRIMVSDNSAALTYGLKTLYHITLILGVFCWCIYADSQMSSHNSAAKKRPLIIMAPSVVPIALAIINLYTHKLFIISEAGVYIRGSWFQLEMFYLLGFSVLYAVKLLLHARYESEPVARFHLMIASTFPLCILISWALSFAGESFPVICVTVMLELLLLSLGTIMQQISIDRLTQVNNRQNLLGFMDYKLKNHESDVYLMMMDMDDFKQINDTYGHIEGDNALVHAAAGIKAACGGFVPRPYIARYGGDEFIVVIETDDPADIKRISESIGRNLQKYDEKAPYRLRLSIGCARFHKGQTPKELIHEADKMLYDIKKKKEADTKDLPRGNDE